MNLFHWPYAFYICLDYFLSDFVHINGVKRSQLAGMLKRMEEKKKKKWEREKGEEIDPSHCVCFIMRIDKVIWTQISLVSLKQSFLNRNTMKVIICNSSSSFRFEWSLFQLYCLFVLLLFVNIPKVSTLVHAKANEPMWIFAYRSLHILIIE